MPLEQIKEVFQRINSTSYGLNAMELNNSRYGGAFKQLAEWMAQQPVFERMRIFSASDIRRMNDIRFCLAALASIMGAYFNRDKELELYLSKYDESVPNEETFRNDIGETLKIIDAMNFSSTSRASKKADFFTLFVELFREIIGKRKIIDISRARTDLETFYLGVEQATPTGDNDYSRYYKATLQASNDRSSRILRGEIISKLLKKAEKS